jgi:hypothetical protein
MNFIESLRQYAPSSMLMDEPAVFWDFFTLGKALLCEVMVMVDELNIGFE